MDGDDHQRYRERLLAERARVSHLVEQVRAEIDGESDTGELADYDQHPADAGSDTFEREKDLSVLDALEAELAEIEAALGRIDRGTYGVDENTGDPIDPDRLDALPTARTNVPSSTRTP